MSDENEIREVWCILRGDIANIGEIEPEAFTTLDGAKNYVLSRVANYYLDPIEWKDVEEDSVIEAEVHLDTWTLKKLLLS